MKTIRILSTVIVAAWAISTVSVTSAEAGVCKNSSVSTMGKWQWTYAAARWSARLAWKKKVRATYGVAYNKWWRAKQKSYGCWQYKSRERCRVWARPCRSGN